MSTGTPARGSMEVLSALPRVLLSGAAGAAAAAIVGWFVPWQITALAGWIVAAGTFATWIIIGVAGLDPVGTERVATREDDSRSGAEIVLLLASVFSLLGVGTALLGASGHSGGIQAWTAGIALLSVAVAWLDVQLVFTLRYAHLYYSGGGGIDFNFTKDEKPDYRDFAYVSFTLGMTYQVSDTAVSSRHIRRTMTEHALLSYVFGVGVIATMVNVVVSLVRT